MTDYGPATEAAIAQVIEACEKYGSNAIIALAGVPGTGKSFAASIAAQRFAGEPLLVREVQFHQSFSYEEFVEGMRIDATGGVSVLPGILLEWNDLALQDPDNRYVLLIEELSRANISAVLGELMTYIEYRRRPFLTVYSRRPVTIAPNLTIIATYNPIDRSALGIDAALLRRMRVIRFLPSREQLFEMLSPSTLAPAVVEAIGEVFDACATAFPEEYEHLMPFGHGIFASVEREKPDLYQLWVERIEHILRRPLEPPHPFAEVIADVYRWRDPDYSVL